MIMMVTSVDTLPPTLGSYPGTVERAAAFPPSRIAVRRAMCEPPGMVSSEREIRRLGRFVGMLELVGVLGVLGTIVMLFDGQHVACALFLTAAALAYGLGANALLRS